ncbi:hypothetical protein A2863_01715 [Candidatus Woesebacteria bacterium RIFCSPHIGHO2_01_FULL_38_9b]|uniref:Probable peptidoglycan glycosyltransferase FtsW n=1 Tax=Candidatus Woesebacteria bacterium RIFCSPHIGHO2_01_FULL_38_9b TaxID=1802493 RepID=A0A1F7XZY6_9BACT|nr:MAG: hypothetical protein A2863_01715 [Candidatus Woesebacteria bacterium RIFCSPHIGHO2_01_FULL_38_9b]
MFKSSVFSVSGWILILSILILLSVSTFVLHSIEPSLYPDYFVYVVLSAVLFIIFTRIDFDIFSLFSPHLYVLSILLLILPLIIGQVTRGAIRWIPIGSFTIQSSEIVRAFLMIFFATYLTSKELSMFRLMKLIVLFFLPFILILIQPSLGVAVLTAIGFLGVLLASSIEKKYFLIGLLVFLISVPGLWFILQPYQRQRIVTFVNPEQDPLGSGYNSIQSTISVGSGRLFGRGLGEGVQTQLEFLPEKHTDFIFAAISEELGFVGALLIICALFTLLFSLIHILGDSINPTARAYVSGIFLILFTQTMIHIGMNMGLLPITGVPLPLVSAGGSSLIGTTLAVAIALKSKRN